MFLVSILVTTEARAPKFDQDRTFGVSIEIASLNYFLAEDVLVFLPWFLEGLLFRRFIIYVDCAILDILEPIQDENFDV